LTEAEMTLSAPLPDELVSMLQAYDAAIWSAYTGH